MYQTAEIPNRNKYMYILLLRLLLLLWMNEWMNEQKEKKTGPFYPVRFFRLHEQCWKSKNEKKKLLDQKGKMNKRIKREKKIDFLSQSKEKSYLTRGINSKRRADLFHFSSNSFKSRRTVLLSVFQTIYCLIFATFPCVTVSSEENVEV